MLSLLFLIAGIVGLYFGAGYVVESTKALAEKMNISQAAIGLTIISIGTSIPEIMTNIFSGLKVRQGLDAAGIAIGTNLGSDITQITFILGFTAIFGTLYATKNLIKRDFLMVLFSIVLVFIAGITGYRITFIEGIIMLALYIIYLYFISRDAKYIKTVVEEELDPSKEVSTLFSWIIMILGIAVLIVASDLVVGSALKLAEVWGVSQSFIGVMIIGVGTGLPELSTAIRAIFKKAGDISLGTLIGSNVTDPMLSLPLGAIAAGSTGLVFEKNLLFFDIPFWFIASCIALLFFIKNKEIGPKKRIASFVLIGLYLLFITIKIFFFRGY